MILFTNLLKISRKIPILKNTILFRKMSKESCKIMKIAEKTIGTHSGVFHCDELLACWMLKQLPEYRASKILRTRDQKLLDQCEIVVDVGGEYSVENKRFDHHQKSFEDSFSSLRPDFGPEMGKVRLVYQFSMYFYFRESWRFTGTWTLCKGQDSRQGRI
jgi:hypothetical protein